MAGTALVAELRFKNTHKEKISVEVENHLSSLIRAIHELNPNVSRLLSELVERGKNCETCAEDEEKGDSDDEDEDSQNSKLLPPAKRSKT
ncbi:hypothetical protein PAMP_014684 [Pampus punctatissimus]